MNSKRSTLASLALAAAAAIGGVAALTASPQARAQASAPLALDFGSTFVGSTWYQYAAAMGPLMQAALPAGSSITVRPYAGANGNIGLIAKNDRIQIGLTFNASANWSATAEGDKGRHVAENVRALFGGLDENFIAIMTTQKSGITSLKDIKAKQLKVRIVSLPVGGLAYEVTRRILALYGVTEDDIRAWGGGWDKVNIQTAGNAMADGRADLWINPAALGHPKIMEISQTTRLNFLDLDAEVIRKLEIAGLSPATLPANAFNGQTKPVQTVAATTMLIVNKAMDERLAYALTKAVVGQADKLKNQNKGLRPFNPATAWRSAAMGGIPLHSGADKYFVEAGLKK